MGFAMDIYPRVCFASVWLTIALMYMIIKSDEVQTNRVHGLVSKPSPEFQSYRTEF